MSKFLCFRRLLRLCLALSGLILTACSQAPLKNASIPHQIPETAKTTTKVEPSRSPSQSAGLLELLRQHFGASAVSSDSAVSHSQSQPELNAEPDSRIGELNFDIIEMADSLTGVPYRSGGTTPKGFDCSGFVYYVYAQLGIQLPRSSREQMHSTMRIEDDELQPGDLLFFKTPGNTNSHVGIYTGNHRFIHAPSRGKVVSYSSMTEPYWRKHYIRAGRIFN